MSAFLQRLVDGAASLPPLAVPVPRSASPIFALDQRLGIPELDLPTGFGDAPVDADPSPPVSEARRGPVAAPEPPPPVPTRPVVTVPQPHVVPIDGVPPSRVGPVTEPVLPSVTPARPAAERAAPAPRSAGTPAVVADARPLPVATVQQPPPRVVPAPEAPMQTVVPAPPAPPIRLKQPTIEPRSDEFDPLPRPPAQPRRSLLADVTRAQAVDPLPAPARRPVPELRPPAPRVAELAPSADLPPPRTETVRETVRIVEKVIAEPRLPRRDDDKPPRLPLTAESASVIGSLEPMRWRNRVFALRRL